MLHEYALDPETFKNVKDARYLTESFGFEHGRLISKFPKAWKRMVWEACRDCPHTDRSRIEILLGRQGWEAKLLASNRDYDPNDTWLENAATQSRVRAFRAVITNSRLNSDAVSFTVDQLDEGLEEWRVPRGITVRRTISDLTQCLEPILSSHKEIIFVDPYFSPFDRRWKDAFIGYLNRIHSKTRALRRVEVHLDATVRPNKPDPLTSEAFRAALELRNYGYPSFAELMPSGSDIVFVRWKEKPNGERLHDRFVLTEYGGVSIPGGLDPGQPGQTTDVNLLSPTVYVQRWNDYQIDASRCQPPQDVRTFQPAFELVDRIKVKDSRATIVPQPIAK